MLLPSALISLARTEWGISVNTLVLLPGLLQQGGNLGEVGAVVHHRQQYAVDSGLGVDLPLHLVYGLEQLFQALGGQVLRLNGDYDPVGGGQGVDREHTQGWLAVNQDMGILSLERVQILPQDGLSSWRSPGHLHAESWDVCGHQGQRTPGGAG